MPNFLGKLILCVTGSYTDWTAWTACSVSCGQGSKLRMRACFGGSCTGGDGTEVESCGTIDCQGAFLNDTIFFARISFR